MSTYVCPCTVCKRNAKASGKSYQLLTLAEIGVLLRPDKPLWDDSARKEMARAGIRVVRGYPADAVAAYVASRRGRGRRRVSVPECPSEPDASANA